MKEGINNFKYLDIDKCCSNSFSFINNYTEKLDFKYTSGYTRELNSHHCMMTYTLIASNSLFPSLKSAIDYYTNNKNNLSKYEKVYIIIRLTDDINNSSFKKIYIDNYFDINTVLEYLSEEEYMCIKELIMEMKLKY